MPIFYGSVQRRLRAFFAGSESEVVLQSSRFDPSHVPVEDCSLVVCGTSIGANREKLCEMSPYLCGQFEKHTDSRSMSVVAAKSVNVSMLEVDIVRAFVEYINTGGCKIKCSQLMGLMEAAHMFVCNELHCLCDEALAQRVRVDVVVEMWWYAEQYGLRATQGACLCTCAENILAIYRDDSKMKGLTIDMMESVLKNDGLVVGAEEDVFYIVIKWDALHTLADRKLSTNELRQLWRWVRFPLMDDEFIWDHVYKNDVPLGIGTKLVLKSYMSMCSGREEMLWAARRLNTVTSEMIEKYCTDESVGSISGECSPC